MRKVGRPNSQDATTITAKVLELCDATSEQTEAIADSYVVMVPAGFTPSRTLDLTAAPSVATVAAVLATFLMDLRARGVNKRAANV